MPDHNKCPLCGSAESVLLFECKDHLVTGEFFPLKKCKSCGFIFTDNYPDQNNAPAYYRSDEYISHTDANKGLVNKTYHLIRKWMLADKYKILKKESGLKTASVLDIGSGTGYFPSYLKHKGWSCSGIEISEEARSFARREKNVELLAPEDIDTFLNGSMDIITMWHTLEHFYKPGDYLQNAHRILNDKGLLVIAIPNNLSYDAGHYKAFWAAWDVPRHLWHFNPATIEKLSDTYGFRLIKKYRLPYDAFYISILSERYRNSKTPLLKGSLTGLISWIRSVFNIEKTSSLVYIFKKG